MAVHYFCLTKEFQKPPDYSAIYQLERNLTVFYIAQIVPSFVVLYLNEVTVKSRLEISQNFVAFSEYTDFKIDLLRLQSSVYRK